MAIEIARKSPAGELFSQSAAATRKLEHIALTLGTMVDIIREITVRPLTDSQRLLAMEALQRLDALDPWAQALGQVRARLKTFADDLDR